MTALPPYQTNKQSTQQGEYNSPWVSVYVTLPGVGEAKDNVSCSFTPSSFDLKVGERMDGGWG